MCCVVREMHAVGSSRQTREITCLRVVPMIVDPTAPSYVRRGLDEARVISECEVAKRSKHVLNGATISMF